MTGMLTSDQVRRAPKALLHDHLDGGLRPATIIDLAREHGYRELPTEDEAALTTWFRRGADRKSLELYLETFAHTTGVMQHASAIERVAAECVEDLAADGVVYAEVRFAPELSRTAGLTDDEVVAAVVAGLREGERRAAAAGNRITSGAIVCGMRQGPNVMDAARAAIRHRDAGVCGFDIAGPEAGFPPGDHAEAFALLRREGVRITCHAGESYGPPSIREALAVAGTERLGHGNHLRDDITFDAGGAPVLGRLARHVRDRGIPLESCPTSNVHTGFCAAVAEHPFDLLYREGFKVTVNTDNRLMSGVSATSEHLALATAFGYGLDDMETFTTTAIEAAFLALPAREALLRDVVRPGYARLRGDAA
ncbi:MAG: adenosine deaminase [Chloroflexota bacterium]